MALNVLKPKYRTREVLDSIKECLDIGWTGMGNKTIEFENKFKEYTQFEHAHFVNSATAGLHLALNVFKKQNNWDEKSEIITTPLTFVSTNHSILYEGLNPVFADVDNELCLDPKSIEQNITPNTKAVMFVGLGGNIGQYNAVKELCIKYGLKLIFDAAHCMGTTSQRIFHGAVIADSQVGWDADATIFSFQAVKNLPTADSGMVCFKHSNDDQLSRQISWLGIDKDTFSRSKGSYKWDYDVPNIGFKYNGNSIMAAIGIEQLKYIKEDNQYRRNLVEKYISNLNKNITIIPHNSECSSARHLFQILVEDRERLLEYLYSKDIFPGVHYKSNKEYPMFKNCNGKIPKAAQLHTKILSLPLHLNLSIKDIQYICDTINKYYE
jgi:dTDP-4-amino-4,6-dideoxygalactose transaminase